MYGSTPQCTFFLFSIHQLIRCRDANSSLKCYNVSHKKVTHANTFHLLACCIARGQRFTYISKLMQVHNTEMVYTVHDMYIKFVVKCYFYSLKSFYNHSQLLLEFYFHFRRTPTPYMLGKHEPLEFLIFWIWLKHWHWEYVPSGEVQWRAGGQRRQQTNLSSTGVYILANSLLFG